MKKENYLLTNEIPKVIDNKYREWLLNTLEKRRNDGYWSCRQQI